MRLWCVACKTGLPRLRYNVAVNYYVFIGIHCCRCDYDVWPARLDYPDLDTMLLSIIMCSLAFTAADAIMMCGLQDWTTQTWIQCCCQLLCVHWHSLLPMRLWCVACKTGLPRLGYNVAVNYYVFIGIHCCRCDYDVWPARLDYPDLDTMLLSIIMCSLAFTAADAIMMCDLQDWTTQTWIQCCCQLLCVHWHSLLPMRLWCVACKTGLPRLGYNVAVNYYVFIGIHCCRCDYDVWPARLDYPDLDTMLLSIIMCSLAFTAADAIMMCGLQDWTTQTWIQCCCQLLCVHWHSLLPMRLWCVTCKTGLPRLGYNVAVNYYVFIGIHCCRCDYDVWPARLDYPDLDTMLLSIIMCSLAFCSLLLVSIGLFDLGHPFS